MHPHELDSRQGVPIRRWDRLEDMEINGPERHIIAAPTEGGLPVDALLMPRASDTLIVSFHGAIQRDKYELPRYEWFGTLRDRSESLLFVADTTLTLNDEMKLSWYTGTADDDLTVRIAQLITNAAELSGASTVVLFGFSGGGYTALAIAPLVPGSLAVAFSPQTSVGAYYEVFAGEHIRTAFPGYASVDEAMAAHGARLSLLERYRDESITPDFWYFQNTGDYHHMRLHCGPFLELTSTRPGARFQLSFEAEGHVVPGKDVLTETLDEAVRFGRRRTTTP
jgi:hypothetical protein